MIGSETQVYLTAEIGKRMLQRQGVKDSSVYILFTSRPMYLISIPRINFVIYNCELYYCHIGD